MLDHASASVKLRSAYKTISGINRTAYKDVFLIPNQVLSKNPFTTNYLNRFLNDETPRRCPIHVVIYKINEYYVKSLCHFFSYLAKFIEYSLFGPRFTIKDDEKEIVLIDTFFVVGKIKAAQDHSDPYFLGLESVLKKLGKRYAYIPFFFSPSDNKKPAELSGALKVLSRKKVPVLSEFQLLNILDILKIFYFILAYPFHVLRFTGTLKTDDNHVLLLKNEILNTINSVTFYAFARYLQGRRIARLGYDKIKVISWDENHPMHKALYKGLRSGAPGRVKIYGGQLFLYSKNCLNYISDEEEAALGLVPDKIIVSGSYYIPENTHLNYVVGPALRYGQIYDVKIDKAGKDYILVLLPYVNDDIENILRIVSKTGLNKRLVIKFHPATSIERYRGLIPPGAEIVSDNIYKLFERARMVISAASGTLVEAASLGIPVIAVRNPNRFDFDNSLPEYGKGMIWEEAAASGEMMEKMSKIEDVLKERPGDIEKIAAKYKDMFFCRPSEAGIIAAFEL